MFLAGLRRLADDLSRDLGCILTPLVAAVPQLLGDALIGDRKTDKMTVRASSELFERVEVHSAVVLGTDYVSAATLHACDLWQTQPTYPNTPHT